MKITLTWGQVRIEARADRKSTQRVADVKLNGAARERTLIFRVGIDNDHGWGNKRGPMLGGYHVAQCVGTRRVFAIAYRTHTGLPITHRQLAAPAFSWWPQHRR